MTLEPTWRFHRMGRDEPGIDPVQEEFFVTGKLVTGDLDFKSVEVEIKIGWLK